jgi:hypothetical protein
VNDYASVAEQGGRQSRRFIVVNDNNLDAILRIVLIAQFPHAFAKRGNVLAVERYDDADGRGLRNQMNSRHEKLGRNQLKSAALSLAFRLTGLDTNPVAAMSDAGAATIDAWIFDGGLVNDFVRFEQQLLPRFFELSGALARFASHAVFSGIASAALVSPGNPKLPMMLRA